MSDASSKPNKVPWHPLTAVALIIGLYFGASLLAGTLLAPLLQSFSIDFEGVTAQFLYVVLIEVITLGAVIWFLKSRKSSLAILGLGRFKPKHIGIGLAVYPIYFIGFVALVAVSSVLFPALNVDQEQQLGFDNVAGAAPLIMTFISLVVLPPIIEEITVRGMIFTSLRSRLALLTSTLLTSFAFAIAHFPAGGFIAAIDTFMLSLVLCTVREKTGSLWPCITLHAIKNGIAYVSLFIVPLVK